ncbi:hypothetical protein F2Q69_00007197 [Brassica cretica]|uniref:Uncharacterized protein n=1 Tax=Brassica cretica TaxID=69181 RepID=A0A8S9P598_BRACR|nr:hypothetical protein F2Q69_00007197 [Brassica cretica]
MTPSSLFFNEKFSSLVLSKPSASSVLNGTSVLVNEFNIVIMIEELEDRNEMVYHQLEILLDYVRDGGDNSSSLEGERGVLVVVVAQLSEAFFIDLEEDISFIGLEQDIEFM